MNRTNVMFRLAWDPKEYGDVDVLRVPTSEIWRPDLKLYNELVRTPKRWRSSGHLISARRA
jgi:hypothetical protein